MARFKGGAAGRPDGVPIFDRPVSGRETLSQLVFVLALHFVQHLDGSPPGHGQPVQTHFLPKPEMLGKTRQVLAQLAVLFEPEQAELASILTLGMGRSSGDAAALLAPSLFLCWRLAFYGFQSLQIQLEAHGCP